VIRAQGIARRRGCSGRDPKKPIKQSDLEPAIAITMRRFEEFQAMRHEADDLRQALEDRKTIERAKESS
jgi:AmiR/NasT family two-component response regulator